MTPKHIDRLTVRHNGVTVGTLSLSAEGQVCAFEYDSAWLQSGFSISPIELPLKPGLFLAKPQPFAGNFGVFDDSLPDGYGRYLMHKALMLHGVDDTTLTAIERLSMVGSGGMGALTYEPTADFDFGDTAEPGDFDRLQQIALNVLCEKDSHHAGLLLFNSRNSGGCRPKALYSDADGHWLVKFRHTYDPQDMGIQELRYNELARRCGLNVPDSKLTNGRYFTVRRFDISPSGERLHTVTAGGLLCVSLDTPVLDYRNLLALTGYITQRPDDVEEMFRRMVFNYLTDNKDDHCKNFSFSVCREVDGWRWHLAPAYDLTRCTEGYNGEHATSVNGTGHPTVEDMVSVGVRAKMAERRCREIIAELRRIIGGEGGR
jgi:serine/threonine-protein kinase HipA